MIIKSLVFRPPVPTNWPKMTALRWAWLAGILLMFAYVPSTGVSTTESYEQLLEAVKSGRFSVDKDKDRGSKDVLQQILDKSKYREDVIKSFNSPVLKDRAQRVHTKLTNLKIGSKSIPYYMVEVN